LHMAVSSPAWTSTCGGQRVSPGNAATGYINVRPPVVQTPTSFRVLPQQQLVREVMPSMMQQQGAATQADIPVRVSTANPPMISADTLRKMPDHIGDSYAKLLNLVARSGFFNGLRTDQNGELRIGVPFCGSFTEARAFVTFIQQNLLAVNPHIRTVKIFASDVCPTGATTVAKAAPQDPRIFIDVRQADLSSETMPECGLSVGLHPQPLPKTPDRKWERIIANIMNASDKTLFTCWMKFEAEEMMRILQSLGSNCSLHKNPAPLDECQMSGSGETASMRFHWIIFAHRPTARTAP